jgi:hypothetical protein
MLPDVSIRNAKEPGAALSFSSVSWTGTLDAELFLLEALDESPLLVENDDRNDVLGPGASRNAGSCACGFSPGFSCACPPPRRRRRRGDRNRLVIFLPLNLSRL